MTEHPSPLLITKHVNRGFTLIEMMIVLMIVSMSTISLSLVFKPFTISDDVLFSDYLKHTQIKALATATKQIVETDHSNVSKLSFNELGNVNMAQTITLSSKKIVIQLGMGRYIEQ